MDISPLCNIDDIDNSHIILDTGVLFDLSLRFDDFEDFLNFKKAKNLKFATIVPVRVEYLKGCSLFNDYKDKLVFLDNFIDVIFPIHDEEVVKNVERLAILLREKGKSLSTADFLLAATLMKYRNSNPKVYLLTKNYHDFPLPIFRREKIMTASLEKDIVVYTLFSFDHQGYREELSKYLSIPSHKDQTLGIQEKLTALS